MKPTGKQTPGLIAEATRLTRAGRLMEATELLRANAAGLAAETAAPSVDPTPAPKGKRVVRLPMGAALPGMATPKNTPFHASASTNGNARFEQRVFNCPEGGRPYKIYIPEAHSGQAAGLIVMMHGCTQTPDAFAAATGMNRLAEELNLIVVWPGQTRAANANRCWNWFSTADQQRGRGEPAIIATLAQQVGEEFGIAPAQTFVAGLSAGGAAAAVLGATYPDVFSAVGVHSGLANGAAQDTSSAFGAMQRGGAGDSRPLTVRTIVFHGDSDSTVHPVNGEHVIAQAATGRKLKASIARGAGSGQRGGDLAHTRTIFKNADGSVHLEHWLIHGAGHGWSGGDPSTPFTEPRGPDASREMARFFLGK